jgi:short-subunit dehydrogenase
MLQQQIELNLLSPILLTRALLPALKKTGNARVLNIGSTFGSIGYPGYTAYCASKFGLRGFTEALRRELADTGLCIMYLAPRATATTLNTANVVEMNKALGNGVDSADLVAEKAVAMLIDGKPATRFIGNPEGFFARLNQIIPALVDGSLRKQLSDIRHYATSVR